MSESVVPRLSVIIPTNRERGFLGAALASVLRNIDATDEVIIVCNGATPEYRAALERLVQPQVRVLSIETAGVAHGRMAGARAAAGTLLLFLDDDDELIDGGVRALRSALAAEPTWSAAVGQVTKFGTVPETPLLEYTDGPTLLDLTRLLVFPLLSPGVGVIRRSAFDRTPGFVQELAPAEDWDAWLRLSQLGPIVGFATPMLRYRQHPLNASGNATLMASRSLDVFAEFRHAGSGRSFRRACRSRAAELRTTYGPRLRSALRNDARQLHLRSAWRTLRLTLRLSGYALRDHALYGLSLFVGRNATKRT